MAGTTFRWFGSVFRCFHCFRRFRPMFHPGHSFSPTLQQKPTAATQAQSATGHYFGPKTPRQRTCALPQGKPPGLNVHLIYIVECLTSFGG